MAGLLFLALLAMRLYLIPQLCAPLEADADGYKRQIHHCCGSVKPDNGAYFALNMRSSHQIKWLKRKINTAIACLLYTSRCV